MNLTVLLYWSSSSGFVIVLRVVVVFFITIWVFGTLIGNLITTIKKFISSFTKKETKKNVEKNIVVTNSTTTKVTSDFIAPVTPPFDYEAAKNSWIREQLKLLAQAGTLRDLLKSKDVKGINYADLLACVEWKVKRLNVLIRDKYACQDCFKRSKSNHVHHTYYLKDSLPWLIETQALVTLCHKCHTERHRRDDIGVFEFKYGKLVRVPYFTRVMFCSRCGGTGYLPIYEHVEHGICFKCRGACIDQTIFSVALQRVKSDLDNYSSYQIRLDYKHFLDSTTYDTYKNCIHVGEEKPRFIDMILNGKKVRIEDDLPF